MTVALTSFHSFFLDIYIYIDTLHAASGMYSVQPIKSQGQDYAKIFD